MIEKVNFSKSITQYLFIYLFIMLVILFPKEFERNLFLLSIGKTNIIYLDTIFKQTPAIGGNIEQECVLIALKDSPNIQNKMLFAIIGVIGTSDVDFNRHFLEFLNEFKKSLKLSRTWEMRKKSFIFLLAGTCGGSKSEKDNIGDCFRVLTAHKFDRGSIVDIKRGHSMIKINEDLTLTSEASWNPQSLSSNIAIHINMLNNVYPNYTVIVVVLLMIVVVVLREDS